MRILVTGSGRSGSWQIRGEQLGRAIGAVVTPNALDVAAYDAAIVVKRPPADLVARIHRAGIPLIWDVVDAWPQPGGNDWSRAECLAWMAQQVKQIKPAAIICATKAMAADAWAYGPVKTIPHHSRPGIERATIRPLKVIGYEGGENYIRGWRRVIDAECKKRGLRFVVNPPRLCDVDIVLALRDQTRYAPRNWKSNVKLANAQGAGVPIICAREAGYLETSCGAERWADTPAELAAALDDLTPIEARQTAAAMMRPTLLADVAKTYSAALSCVMAQTARA